MSLDPATVQRCIAALSGTGKYGYTFERISDFEPPHRVETWTYTTHPMDVLKGLLAKDERRAEAEKLVDEWLASQEDDDYGVYSRTQLVDLVSGVLSQHDRAELPSRPTAVWVPPQTITRFKVLPQ